MALEERVEKLEQENRRLKLVLALSMLLASGGVLMGLGGQQQQILSARELRIVDENGDTRIRLGTTPQALDLSAAARNRPGQRSLPGTAELMPGRLEVIGESESAWLAGSTLMLRGDSTAEELEDPNSFVSQMMGAENGPTAYFGTYGVVESHKNAAISLLDEDGNIRSKLGAVRLTSQTAGAETSYPAAIALYDAEGKVIWMAPR